MTSTLTAPVRLGGRWKVLEETIVSPFEKESKDDALKVLEEIRKVHDSRHGWFEVIGTVEQLPNGKWRAVRRHAQYA